MTSSAPTTSLRARSPKTLGSTLLVLIGLMVASSVLAQPQFERRPGGPPFGGHKFAEGGKTAGIPDRLIEALKLTDEQAAQWEQLQEGFQASTAPLREDLGQTHEALKAQMEDEQPDPASVGQLMIDARNLRQDLGTAHEQLREDFTSLLDDEQRTRYETIQEMGPGRRGDRRRGPRRGGPRGRGGV